MKGIISIFILIFFYINVAFGTTYTTVVNGNWNNNSTWSFSSKPGTYFGAGDTVIVNHNINFNQNVGFAGVLIINSGGSLNGLNRSLSLNDGASIFAYGETMFKNLTLNAGSSGTFEGELTIDNNLTVGNGSSFITNGEVTIGNNFTNNGGVITMNEMVNVLGNLTNNNGEITFNEIINISGDFTNNNSNAEVFVNDDLTISGDFENNGGGIFSISSGAIVTVEGDIDNNNSSEINNEGRINSEGNFSNNGGAVYNEGTHFVDGNFIQNGGIYTNNGVLIARSNFTVNNRGTVDGSGIIRANNIVNYGNITGTNDLCGLDDATPTVISGNSVGASTTNCMESASVALPITLTYFKVEREDSYLICKWQTMTEINNNYFEIQYSKSGATFQTLLKERGAGNSSQPLKYESTLRVAGRDAGGYYRLKQTDFNGKFTYSKVIFLENDISEDMGWLLFPNPGDGSELYLRINPDEMIEGLLQIYNSKGEMIKQKEYRDFYTNGKISLLDEIVLKKGIYMVNFLANQNRLQETVIVR